ncbi:TonB family protein [Stutzerimonas stutzeri]|uniref:TonB family protein n=1 Tax=Stutzerimonas stutzeri TaxID=316 RepID=UPI00210C2C42|nr:TonB family protein [Stutzerimonas stutzeri]MCQ4260197.1 TonB family protein [Stutzerimonas stutzeri]
MKLCVIALIVSYSLLSGCNSTETVVNTNRNERAVSTPVQVQEISPQNSIPAEPTESKKQRALRELLSEAVTYQQTQTLNTKDPADLFALYTTKIFNNFTTPKDLRPEAQLILDVQMSADGKISSIEIAQTSGDYQFDKAAILAIRSIGIFSEVKDLSEVDYNKYFKFHKLKFKSGPLMQSGN